MIWLIIGFISYFLLKRLGFAIQTKEGSYRSERWDDFIKPENWTYGAAILSIVVCTLGGIITLVAYLVCLVVCMFNNDIKFKGSHWFNKQSKL